MNLHFRMAQMEDVDILLKLEQEAFPIFQQSDRKKLNKGIKSSFQEILIVESSGTIKQPIGSIVLYKYKHTLRIYSIALFGAYRKKGLGHELLQYIKEYALQKHYSQITLEVRKRNCKLVAWYESKGFEIVSELIDYYKPGENAFKMQINLENSIKNKGYRNIIVIDQPFKWENTDINAKIISVKEYINDKSYQNNSNFRVFNLCSSYKYQSYGYYVSLLASARGQRIIPNITTISDFRNINVIQSVTFELNDFITNSLASETQKTFSLDVYFGQTHLKSYKTLAAKLYQIFEAPLFRINLINDEKWLVKSVKVLSFKMLDPEQRDLMYQSAYSYFNKKRYNYPTLTNYLYDLAILVNPSEENPPSDAGALDKFKSVANKKGVYVELITKEDKNKINEFDALFIRETTNVNHHTYEFSRLAFAEGLVVMDDPWSILRCSNKIYQNELFKRNKIKTPNTVALTKNNFNSKLLREFNYPVVLKQPDSAFSLGVTKVTNEQEAEEGLKKLFKKSDMVVCQEFLYSEYDWRIGVLDNNPIFACKYFMTKNHWQIYDWNSENEDKSGAHETIPVEEVPSQVLKVAQKAASLIGDGLYGVDLKLVEGEVYVIEVNDNPNIDLGVEDAALKDDLYSMIIDSFINRIEIAKNIRKINLVNNKHQGSGKSFTKK